MRRLSLIAGPFILLFLFCMSGTSLAQTSSSAPSGPAGFVRMAPIPLDGSVQPVSDQPLLVFPSDALTSRGSLPASLTTDANAAGSGPGTAAQSMAARTKSSPIGGVITGLDTVPTFAGAFAGQAGPSSGTVFPFIMIGNDPRVGGTTRIPVKMTAVSLQLLAADGTLVPMPFAPFEDLTEDSPNFAESNFSSGRHIQFGDAVQRAEFFKSMDEDWHTVLDQPVIVNRVTFTIPPVVNVQLPDGTIKQVPAYILRQAPNGDPFVEMLDLLFNALNLGQAVNDINAGNFTTDAININMYPNTFLFSIDSQGNFAGCCVIGYHTYFLDRSVTPQPRWMFDFASWTSPGIFRGGLQDVTALSHEISETLNDPFVNTATPRWQFPVGTSCQGNLETGDPVEVLGSTTVDITLRERNEVFTYHPQTEALLQWFEMGAKSDAIRGAFSYPSIAALPTSALPCPQ
jgi:hypothetical protein